MNDKNNEIIFNFQGGMADEHELNFYAAARFQYAAARLIYKLEYYRQTGHLLDRISKKVDADIRVSAAREGSWELGIILEALPELVKCKVTVPLGALVSYVFNYIKPKSKGKSLALELAKVDLAKEKQRTLQTQEETRRLEIMASLSHSNREPTAPEALRVINNYNFYQVENLVPGLISGQKELDYIKKELEAEEEFEKSIEEYKDELDQISPEKITQIATMFKNAADELAYPLKNSANELSISVPHEKSGSIKKVCVFNKESLEGLSKEYRDEAPTYMVGSIKRYDKETGWGQFRNTGLFTKPISFNVPGGKKSEMLYEVSKAMASEEIGASFYIVRDKSEKPIRLILNSIVEDKLDNESF